MGKTKELQTNKRLGVKGGKAVVRLLGKKHMSEIGRKGGLKSWKNRQKALRKLKNA